MRAIAIAVFFLAMPPVTAAAQGAGVAFAGMAIDPAAPVEISADALSVSQTDGTAIFDGNVMIAQGALRMTAARVEIDYGADGSREIARLLAEGGVTLVTDTESAEARSAVYAIAEGTVTLTGDVLLVQGPSAISGDRLVVDLATGTGRMEGRVRTTLQAGDGN